MDETFGAQNPPAWQPSQFSSKGKISQAASVVNSMPKGTRPYCNIS